jgi:hypothetical protein
METHSPNPAVADAQSTGAALNTAPNATLGATPGSHNVLSSTPLRLVFTLCLLSFLPEICWAVGLGLESARHGLWPNFWQVTTGIVFTITLFLSTVATFGALVLTLISGRFKQVGGGTLLAMWLLIAIAAAAEVAHLHGYIGLKKRIPQQVEAPATVTGLQLSICLKSPIAG